MSSPTPLPWAGLTAGDFNLPPWAGLDEEGIEVTIDRLLVNADSRNELMATELLFPSHGELKRLMELVEEVKSFCLARVVHASRFRLALATLFGKRSELFKSLAKYDDQLKAHLENYELFQRRNEHTQLYFAELTRRLELRPQSTVGDLLQLALPELRVLLRDQGFTDSATEKSARDVRENLAHLEKALLGEADG